MTLTSRLLVLSEAPCNPARRLATCGGCWSELAGMGAPALGNKEVKQYCALLRAEYNGTQFAGGCGVAAPG